VRTFSALVVATGLVLTLASCSSSDYGVEGIAACDSAIKEGKAAALVESPGEGEPTIDFPTPLVTDVMERDFERIGDGEVLEEGDFAVFQLVQASGSTGQVGGSTWAEEASFAPVSKDAGVLGELLECVPVGSRINAVIPAQLTNPDAPAGETIVAAIDVLDGFDGKAEGAPLLPSNDLPAIALAPSGQPGFTVPNSDAPTDLRVSLLQRGDGKKIAEGDAVVTQFSALKWSTKTVDFSTWEAKQPLALVLDGQDSIQQPSEANPQAATLFVPASVKEKLVGLPLGSQVMISVPAEEASQAGLAAGDALVYVIDLLSIQ